MVSSISSNYVVSNNNNNNTWELKKKTMAHEGDGDTYCNWIDTVTWRLGNKRTSRDLIEIGQNTEKSPGDLRRLAVTQPPVNNHQLTLLCKLLSK